MLPHLKYPILLFLGSFILLLVAMLCQFCGWPLSRIISGLALLMQVMAVVRLLSVFLKPWFGLVFIMGVIVMIAGLMFKIMHWPNAQLVFGGAALVNMLIVVRLVVVFLSKQKSAT